jgi:hypothetical protein
MNCAEFQEVLQSRLNGESSPATAEVERHLKLCPDCRELEVGASRLLEGLRAAAVPPLPEGQRDRIVSLALAQMESQRLARQRWGRLTIGASTVAAGLLLAVFLGFFRSGARQGHGKSDSIKLVKKDEKSAPALSQSALNIQDAGDALVALVNRTAGETVGQGRVLLPQSVSTPNISVAEAWQPDLEPSAQVLRETQEGVTDSLEPVTSSARRAVNLFLREVQSIDGQKQ